MRAGALRHKIRIEKPTTIKTGGVQQTIWEMHAEVYASIEVMKSFDRASAQATFPGADVTITIRYCAGVAANMRVVHGDMIYSILGPPNDVETRHREMVLTCESGVKTA